MMFINLKVISQVKKVAVCRKINKISSSFVLSYSVNSIVSLNMCHQHQHGQLGTGKGTEKMSIIINLSISTTAISVVSFVSKFIYGTR